MVFNNDTTIEDIMKEPSKYGMPTFSQFKNNRHKYLGRPDEKLSQADAGSQILGRYVKRQTYECMGYKCKTIEEVERVALQHGIEIKDLVYHPELIPLGGNWADLHVRFFSKTELARRESL